MPTIELTAVELDVLTTENDEYVTRTVMGYGTYQFYTYDRRPEAEMSAIRLTSQNWDDLKSGEQEKIVWPSYNLTVRKKTATNQDKSPLAADILLEMLNEVDDEGQQYALNEALHHMGYETEKQEQFVFTE